MSKVRRRRKEPRPEQNDGMSMVYRMHMVSDKSTSRVLRHSSTVPLPFEYIQSF